jgi:hypothetical protein
MGVTAIKKVVNDSGLTAMIRNTENPDKFGNGGDVPPNTSLEVDMWIPWARTSVEFRTHHISVVLKQGETWVRSFAIWQAAHFDGDFVRVAEGIPDDFELVYAEPGTRIAGDSSVDKDRSLVVAANGDISLVR